MLKLPTEKKIMFFDNPFPDYIDTTHFNHIELIILIAILWFMLYQLVSLMIGGPATPEFLDTKNRVISIIHGLVSFTLATMDVFGHRAHFNQKNTFFQKTTLDISLGYFLYDWIACYFYGLHDLDLAIHHSITSFGLGSAAFLEFGGSCAIAGIFITEISNCPMHLRKILMTFSLKNTRLYDLFENSYFSLYLTARGILGPWCLVNALRNANVPWPVCLVCLGLNIQNFFMFGRMIKIIRKKVSAYKERQEKGVQLWWIDENPEILKLEYIKKKKNEKEKVF